MACHLHHPSLLAFWVVDLDAVLQVMQSLHVDVVVEFPRIRRELGMVLLLHPPLALHPHYPLYHFLAVFLAQTSVHLAFHHRRWDLLGSASLQIIAVSYPNRTLAVLCREEEFNLLCCATAARLLRVRLLLPPLFAIVGVCWIKKKVCGLRALRVRGDLLYCASLTLRRRKTEGNYARTMRRMTKDQPAVDKINWTLCTPEALLKHLNNGLRAFQ